MLRLQKIKTNLERFEVSTITEYLKNRRLGRCFQNREHRKIHVHTMTPDKVHCQMYGEFLKIKIENMSLQHNNAAIEEIPVSVSPRPTCRRYGVVAVCSGKELKTFRRRGADVIVDGGQSMNSLPRSFNCVSSNQCRYSFCNAQQCRDFVGKAGGEPYSGADVRVVESKTIGEGYAALSMLDPNADSADQLTEELGNAMRGVVTAEISMRADADMQQTKVHMGDYIGFSGKELTTKDNRFDALCATVDKLDFAKYICILIRGAGASSEEAAKQKNTSTQYPERSFMR
ncbi:MAG: hypothetical protein ACLSB9_36535 [Hydrogeniiclostridium mannosilyticum]